MQARECSKHDALSMKVMEYVVTEPAQAVGHVGLIQLSTPRHSTHGRPSEVGAQHRVDAETTGEL